MRKIIHCDCDCFYAAIEMRDDPALLGRPLAVGGRPEALLFVDKPLLASVIGWGIASALIVLIAG